MTLVPPYGYDVRTGGNRQSAENFFYGRNGCVIAPRFLGLRHHTRFFSTQRRKSGTIPGFILALGGYVMRHNDEFDNLPCFRANQ